MERKTSNTGARAKVSKMTKEQMQLAIIKKKQCDSKALKIVEKLLEPQVDPKWLIENLIHINKAHMEDVIEERSITKLCGYVLCQNPITVIINQRYHISLKSKKVYDVTNRKKFCSSSCFGASNYLLQQILTSPLWLRDKEEVPKFKIFCQDNSSSISHGEELDIILIDHLKNDIKDIEDKTISTNDFQPDEYINRTLGTFNDFAFETTAKMFVNNEDSVQSIKIPASENTIRVANELSNDTEEKNIFNTDKSEDFNVHNENKHNKSIENTETDDSSIIKHNNLSISLSSTNSLDNKDTLNSITSLNCTKILQTSKKKSTKAFTDDKLSCKNKNSKHKKKEKTKEKVSVEISLAARVEKSFNEWITEETRNFLIGDDSIKHKTIEDIERQDKYSILCKKLNKLQFLGHQDDSEITKPKLKPLPHFTELQEEAEKLDLKVQAFYQGKTIIEKGEPTVVSKETTESNIVLPMIDSQAPNIFRRRIFLDKLDQILPELLRTLAGNNEASLRRCSNYTSVKCAAIKALIYTFSLSANNISFKTVEWTLVGLIIITMLSLLDPWLKTLLISEQARMYISMILTSYKLDPCYLEHLVICLVET